MGMGRKASFGRNPVVVDDAQRSKTDVPLIVVASERKRMVALQPPQVGVAPFGGLSYQQVRRRRFAEDGLGIGCDVDEPGGGDGQRISTCNLHFCFLIPVQGRR